MLYFRSEIKKTWSEENKSANQLKKMLGGSKKLLVGVIPQRTHGAVVHIILFSNSYVTPGYLVGVASFHLLLYLDIW